MAEPFLDIGYVSTAKMVLIKNNDPTGAFARGKIAWKYLFSR